ncbi:MAG: GEVED domain-containing protein, partial [Flavobacteriales bacterium]
MMNSYISRAGRSLRTFWAAGLSLVALCVFSVSSSWGQLAIRYDFATSSGTYSSISGTGTSVSILGDDLSFNITGLSPGFTVNGTTYTNARMNSNGWLALYTATAPTSTTLYSPLSTALANGAVIIAPFGRDQNGTGAAAWRQTIGNEHIFEWQNFYRFGTSGESLNYQIRLNTATGQISFVYGSFVSSANSTYPQVGWKTNGTTGSNWATDVNNLMLDVIGSPNSCNWSNVVTGNTNTTTLYLNNANSGVAPTSGLTYTWTPQNAVSPVRTFAAVTGITIDGATVSWTAPAGATQYDVQYRIPGSCTWTNWSGNPVLTNTVSLTGLASGTSYQVRVRASNGTNNAIYSHIPNTAGTGSGYNATGTFTTSTPVCTTLGSLTAGTVSSTANPACNGVNFTLSTTGSTTGFGGLTYQWYSSPDNITYTPIGGATGATYVTNITASTWFQREIICSGGPASQFTPGLLITLDVPTNCYCIPGYTSGKTDGDLISQVTIPTTTLNNNTGTSPTNPAFTFFAPNPPSNTTTASLQAGTSYNVQVTYGSFTGQNCAAWVDFNGDGVFSTPSERIGFTTAGSTIAFQQVSFPISIPCNPTPGNYRLRIRDVWNTAGNAIDPCATYGWGETEDYIITITPPDPCPQPSGLALTSVAGTSASISWNVGCVETAWQAVVVPAGNLPGTGTPQNVAVTNATFSGLTTGTAYDAYVRADCLGNGFSSWIGPINFTPNFLVPLSGNVTYGGEICGAVLYDHAGPSADYSNNANGTVELAPANAGDVVQISGTYNVEGCCDNLIIYEGAGTGGAVLFDNISSASGTVNVVSNVPGGTVTVQFTSDVSAVFAGFALNINCVAPPACGNVTGLVATPSGLTAALNWNDVPSAINYQWEVVPQGNAQGVGVVTSGSSATSDASVTSNLSPLTAYTAYVRSECSGGFGLWFSVNFTSGIANDLCSGAIVVGCGASVNGSTTTLNGATNDLMPTQCGAASPDGAQTANG